MTYNITYFIQSWLLPPGILILLLLLGLVIMNFKPRAGKAFLLFSVVLFWLLSIPVFTAQLYTPIEEQYPFLISTKQATKDAAIVVLGGGVNTATSMMRVKYAATFARNTRMGIITSGGNKGRGITEAQAMSDELKDSYTLPTLAMEGMSKNTEDEAKYLLPILKQHNIKHIYIVTNAYHMPRSMNIFNKVFANSGIEITAAPMGKSIILSTNPIANFLPQANSLNASEIILHEYLGLLWMHLKST